MFFAAPPYGGGRKADRGRHAGDGSAVAEDGSAVLLGSTTLISLATLRRMNAMDCRMIRHLNGFKWKRTNRIVNSPFLRRRRRRRLSSGRRKRTAPRRRRGGGGREYGR